MDDLSRNFVDTNCPFFRVLVQNELQELVETYGVDKSIEIVSERQPDDEFNRAFEDTLLDQLRILKSHGIK